MLGQFDWTYYEVYAHQAASRYVWRRRGFLPARHSADGGPGLAAARRHGELQLRLGYLDFISLLAWWTFLYAFAVFPWMYALPSEPQYNFNYDLITNIQNMVIVIGLAGCGSGLKTRGGLCMGICSGLRRCICCRR